MNEEKNQKEQEENFENQEISLKNQEKNSKEQDENSNNQEVGLKEQEWKCKKDYNIGLDIGVASVGWFVTDENNNILKKNNKHMWGSRLFDEAETAKVRRNFRSARRRLNRRKQRIIYLQEIFKDEMNKEYPNFFPMLKEASNVHEDKTIAADLNGIKYNLFDGLDYNDQTYYKTYKTIYHLRSKLVHSKEKADIRLIYLALHHMIKYRGNFLHEEDFADNINAIEEEIENVTNYLDEEFFIETNVEIKKIVEILKDKKQPKSIKQDLLLNRFNYNKDNKVAITNMIKSWLGYSFDVSKIWNIQPEKNKISFSSEIENEDEILELLQDNANVYESMKTIYSWSTLQDILKGHQYISDAFIDKYNKYNKDLKILKEFYKRFYKNEYDDFFRKEKENNYVHYNGKQIRTLKKACNEEEFFKKIKAKAQNLPDDYENKKYILDELESETFLRKLNIVDNGAIPEQLHSKELKAIIENQKEYYPFLAENEEKIIKIFETRIPYYVGPLAKNEGQSKWAWVIRENDGAIRPWNMNENEQDSQNDFYDKDKTAEKFINRMLNKCQYLLTEPVMPKQSILYSKYCVLNELNNIRLNEHHLSTDSKKRIIEELFEKRTKVTKKMLQDFYRKDGMENVTITGLSDGESFNSNMKSYIDMCKIFGKVDESNIDMCEEIIKDITIFEGKKILKRKIKQLGVPVDKINSVMNLKYSGWSSLSKKLLTGIKSFDDETIVQKLEKTPLNLMQIINEKEFGFEKELEKYMPKDDGKITYEDVAEIPTSPANKRAIWQAVCVVNEIKKIMKKEPKNIYIEFARAEENDKRLKDNRAKKLLKMYEEIEKSGKILKDFNPEVYKELKQKQNDKEINEMMYLYFIQNGKSLYSGRPLNLDTLSQDCDIDHIMPRSYKFDDSIDNKALVFKKENTDKKDVLVVPEKYVNNNKVWWKSLLDCGLISPKKYNLLTRRKINETEADSEGFVKRQLVETRQTTKYVANLLKNDNTSVFALRAELTHHFREKYEIPKNRNVNDCHHAQDAYIISTIGNLLDKEWKGIEEFKYGEYLKYVKSDVSKKEKYGMILGFINNRVDATKVKKAINYKDYYVTRMLEEQNGEFYNQIIMKAGQAKIPLKEGKDPNKYGGYTSEKIAYCVIYTYIDKKGARQYQLTGIPIKVKQDIKQNKTTVEKYIKEGDLKNKEYSDFKIIRAKILKNQEYLNEFNESMRLCSDSEVRTAKQLMVDNKWAKIICLMNTKEEKLKDEQKEEVKNSYHDLYEYLLEKMRKEYKTYAKECQKLMDKEAEFDSLDYEKKKSVINGVIGIMHTGQGNLKDLSNMGDREGRRRGVNFETKRISNMTFIDRSVTGMYERRYKINGMENRNSK